MSQDITERVAGYVDELNLAFTKREKALSRLKLFAKYSLGGMFFAALPLVILIISCIALKIDISSPSTDMPASVAFILFFLILFPGGLLFSWIYYAYGRYQYKKECQEKYVTKVTYYSLWGGMYYVFKPLVKAGVYLACYVGCMAAPCYLCYLLQSKQLLTASWLPEDSLTAFGPMIITFLYVVLMVILLIDWLLKTKKFKELRESIVPKLTVSEKVIFDDLVNEISQSR